MQDKDPPRIAYNGKQCLIHEFRMLKPTYGYKVEPTMLNVGKIAIEKNQIKSSNQI